MIYIDGIEEEIKEGVEYPQPIEEIEDNEND